MRRGRIVLLRADGQSRVETASAVDVNRPVVIRWERSFAKLGLAGLADATGRGKGADSHAAAALYYRTPWSVRSMARQVGVSLASVQRIWVANEIKPHLTRMFKPLCDPNFEAKF